MSYVVIKIPEGGMFFDSHPPSIKISYTYIELNQLVFKWSCYVKEGCIDSLKEISILLLTIQKWSAQGTSNAFWTLANLQRRCSIPNWNSGNWNGFADFLLESVVPDYDNLYPPKSKSGALQLGVHSFFLSLFLSFFFYSTARARLAWVNI